MIDSSSKNTPVSTKDAPYEEEDLVEEKEPVNYKYFESNFLYISIILIFILIEETCMRHLIENLGPIEKVTTLINEFKNSKVIYWNYIYIYIYTHTHIYIYIYKEIKSRIDQLLMSISHIRPIRGN